MTISALGPIASPTAKLYEIHYLPTKRSRKVRITGIFADSEFQARRFLRKTYGLRMLDCKVLSCTPVS